VIRDRRTKIASTTRIRDARATAGRARVRSRQRLASRNSTARKGSAARVTRRGNTNRPPGGAGLQQGSGDDPVLGVMRLSARLAAGLKPDAVNARGGNQEATARRGVASAPGSIAVSRQRPAGLHKLPVSLIPRTTATTSRRLSGQACRQARPRPRLLTRSDQRVERATSRA